MSDDLPRLPADITAEIREVRATLQAQRDARDALDENLEGVEHTRQEFIDSINTLGEYLAGLYTERNQARRYWR